MKNKTNTIETILQSFMEEFTEQEGFGGIGGSAVRTVIKWPDNPDFSDEILIDQFKAFLESALRQVQEETREETLQELKDNYEQVQQDLDEEYQDNKYCPNYMGILEERLEVAKLKENK